MSTLDFLKTLVGYEDYDITQEEIDAEIERQTETRNIKPLISDSINSQASNSIKITVIQPSSFEDAKKLADGLKRQKSVIVNFTSVKTEIAKKIFDFLSGATYILNGNVQQLNDDTYIFTASNVTLDVQDGNMWD